MKNLMKNILTVLVVSLLAFSCKHKFLNKEAEFMGDNYCPPKEFAVLDFKVDSIVDLADGISVVNINASFTTQVKWEVLIKGDVSGATKSFSGDSNKVAIKWFGNPDSYEKFFEKENCTVTMKIKCNDIPAKKVILANKPNFKNIGILVTDFEGNGIVTDVSAIGFGTQQFGVYTSDDTLITKSINSTTKSLGLSPQGGNYFYLGRPGKSDSYYLCGSQMNRNFRDADISIQTKFKDPAKVFVNLFYNTNGNPETITTIYIKGSGGVNFSYNLSNKEKGWHYYAIPLQEFKKDGAFITNLAGMRIMGFDLGTMTKGASYAEFAIDFVILTENDPLFKNASVKSELSPYYPSGFSDLNN